MKKYKKRFVKEYKQLRKRTQKLYKLTVKLDADTLDFTPDSPLWVLKDQLTAMENYLHCLDLRAEYENIDLGD